MSGEHLQLLHSALSEAFPTRDELELLTYLKFGVSLEDISSVGDNQRVALVKVVRWFRARGRLTELIETAKLERPQNTSLANFDLNLLQSDIEPGSVATAGSTDDFDTKLEGAVSKLASDSVSMQAVGVVALRGLVQAASGNEGIALYLTILANLRIEYPESVERALVKVFEASIRRQFDDSATRPPSLDVDFNRTSLARIDLAGLDLHEADIAFAVMNHANLTEANLRRARGYAVDLSSARLSRADLEEARLRNMLAPGALFHECRLVSARLEDADLQGAEFVRSRLQGAHLDGADIVGARFEQAKIADADFRGVTIDESAAASLSRAVNWRKAKFDSSTRIRIEHYADGS